MVRIQSGSPIHFQLQCIILRHYFCKLRHQSELISFISSKRNKISGLRSTSVQIEKPNGVIGTKCRKLKEEHGEE